MIEIRKLIVVLFLFFIMSGTIWIFSYEIYRNDISNNYIDETVNITKITDENFPDFCKNNDINLDIANWYAKENNATIPHDVKTLNQVPFFRMRHWNCCLNYNNNKYGKRLHRKNFYICMRKSFYNTNNFMWKAEKYVNYDNFEDLQLFNKHIYEKYKNMTDQIRFKYPK